MTKLEEGLVDALRAGAGVLPGDLGVLADCLRTIGILLAEKAMELEPSWDEALAVAAEIETLFDLETAVAERAIATPAASLAEVLAKLAIWKALSDNTGDGGPDTVRDRLVLSVAADLERLGRRQKAARPALQ